MPFAPDPVRAPRQRPKETSMPYVLKGRNMHALPLSVSLPRTPPGVRTMTLLISVAVAGAFVYAAIVTSAHQSASAAARIASGESHSCELTGSGGVRCRGYNDDGELGDGTTRTR